MATCVTLTWQITSSSGLAVEVSCDNDPHPDLLDELSKRSVYLLNEAAAAVIALPTDDQ